MSDLVAFQKYSQTYEMPDGLRTDSERFRRRLQRLFESHFNGDFAVRLGELIEGECGVDVVTSGVYGSYVVWSEFLLNAERRDVLDAIFLGCRVLTKLGKNAEGFAGTAARICDEEAINISVSQSGEVHLKVDDAFQATRKATIIALRKEKYATAQTHMEAMEEALLKGAEKGREAIRYAFDLNENLFKQIFGGSQLNSSSIKNSLAVAANQKFANDTLQMRSVSKQIEGFRAWVDSVHFYRHASGEELASNPDKTTVILIVSLGMSFARWLAETFDQSEYGAQ